MVIKNGKRVHEAYEAGYNFDGTEDGKMFVFNIDNNQQDANLGRKGDGDLMIGRPFAHRAPFEDPKDVPDPTAVPLHEEEPTDNTGFEVEPGFGPSLDNATADDYEFDRRDVTNEMSPLVVGAFVAGGIGLAMKGLKALVAVVIPLARDITFRLVCGYAKIGACLAVQAYFIEMNAYKLQTSDDYATNPKEMQKVINKQKGVAEKLKKWANKFAIDDKKAEKKAREMVKKESAKKIKIADLQDDIPAEVYNKSLLF